ncbi:hypothetical protein F0562_007474 [Nyssa sinensis]|uniref:Leucine-rich repeat and WD repeat-containing protein 1 LRR domain-containing protein n=1 Tax=Nyssa sinensis TaxID=561372 RepID=A0A5J5A614_9ASTE|nr:hypothetical protein F0562_007474 [Nyssa sinensis]
MESTSFLRSHASFFMVANGDPSFKVQLQVEFTTKSNSLLYKGNILNYMSGIDLSCNQLAGEIPLELGNLSDIRALNLSHNNLTGTIPVILSKLKQVESLDLSYNNLNGRIPTQLIELNALAVFSVAHNNLSGALPERKAQFGTFEETSYEGNPFLCGPPLRKSCTKIGATSPMRNVSNGEVEEDGFVDMDAFYITFVVSYIIVLLGIAIVLYINPYWREACDDEWKFKDGHVMLTNGIDSRSGDVVVLENDGDFERVLGATGFGNLQQVELLQNLMRIRDVDWVSLDAIEASSMGRFVFVADFEIEGGRILF